MGNPEIRRRAGLSFARCRSTDGLNRTPRCASSRSIADGLDYLPKPRQSGSCVWSHFAEETGGVLGAFRVQQFRRHRCNFLGVFVREPPERLHGRHPGCRLLLLQKVAEQRDALRFAVRFDLH